MPPLEDIQREFFAAVRLPLRGASRRSTDLPHSEEGHSQEFLGTAERLMKGTATLSSAERLELYHRQYWFRLLDSVAEDFPILRRMAGEHLFWEMLEAYLAACPSGSFTLRHLGRSMAAFTSGWERLDDSQRRWFAAVAEMEYAAMEIYEAGEREPLPPERIAVETLELQPHVRLLDLPVPADKCAAWETFPADPSAEESHTHLAVWRGREAQGMRARLDPREAELLRRLREGGTLEEILTAPLDPEPTGEEVTAWFSSWQSRGWITARGSAIVELPAGTSGDDWSGVDKMGSQARAMDGH